MKPLRQIVVRKVFVLMMSIFLSGVATMSAETKEPNAFEKFFRSIGNAFSGKPQQQRKPTHRSASHRQSLASPATATTATTATTAASPAPEEPTARATGGMSAPPNESNTRTTYRAVSKKGDDFRYGMPVPGKKGFVISPYSPDSGYIDVRGFQPGTPVKDPYSGKIILTP
jgi:hypothetical protein